MTGTIVRKDINLDSAEISLEYLAGFFDGEGAITITVSGHYHMHVLKLLLTNTNLEILSDIQKIYGGRLQMNKCKARKENWKQSHNLNWTGWAASDILTMLAPKLRIKRQQAELAIKFWEFVRLPKNVRCEFINVPCKGMKNGVRSQWTRTAETRKIEQDFKVRMHALNRRGVNIANMANVQ